eukprot:scaffold3956_cov25-Cyclotella_meneghiniana.AAC.2
MQKPPPIIVQGGAFACQITFNRFLIETINGTKNTMHNGFKAMQRILQKGHDLIAMGILPFSVKISQAFRSYLETSKASRSHVDMVILLGDLAR